MSALTQIFNFLYVYIRNLFGIITGSKIYLSSFNDEQLEIVRTILDSNGFEHIETYYQFPSQPILLVVIGVFALGSIIGLVRRLMR